MPHTPSPWFIAPAHIVPGIRGLGIFGHRGTLGVPVAEVYNVFGDVMEADARLIAAAPDLLKACKDALKTIKSLPEWPIRDELVAKIEVAIAAAEEG